MGWPRRWRRGGALLRGRFPAGPAYDARRHGSDGGQMIHPLVDEDWRLDARLAGRAPRRRAPGDLFHSIRLVATPCWRGRGRVSPSSRAASRCSRGRSLPFRLAQHGPTTRRSSSRRPRARAYLKDLTFGQPDVERSTGSGGPRRGADPEALRDTVRRAIAPTTSRAPSRWRSSSTRPISSGHRSWEHPRGSVPGADQEPPARWTPRGVPAGAGRTRPRPPLARPLGTRAVRRRVLGTGQLAPGRDADGAAGMSSCEVPACAPLPALGGFLGGLGTVTVMTRPLRGACLWDVL